MKSYQITFRQSLPIPIKDCWDFFSSPLNLAKITPPEMAFTVTSNKEHLGKMYPGMIITYKVSPLLGLKLNWMTEITHVAEENYFVDEQRFGPYQFWHHQHHFKKIDGGTEMTDILTYGLPFGLIGRATNALMVRKKIESIFDYRRNKIIEIFGDYPATTGT